MFVIPPREALKKVSRVQLNCLSLPSSDTSLSETCTCMCVSTGNCEFNKLVRENAIVTDAESADNLFKILSQNRASESLISCPSV